MCDLGLSYIKRRAEMSLSSKLGAPRGTYMYMAPELHDEGNVKVTDAQDVWSVACTFIEMFAETPVLPRTLTHYGLLKRIMEGKIVPESLQQVPEPHRAILQPCFKTNPRERPSASQLHAKFEELCGSSWPPSIWLPPPPPHPHPPKKSTKRIPTWFNNGLLERRWVRLLHLTHYTACGVA